MKLTSTLRRTLSRHFLLVAILPALIFGMIAITLLQEHLQTGIYERNFAISQNIASIAERFLAEIETDLQSIGKVVERKAEQTPGLIDNFLASVVYASRRFESIYLLDAQYRVISMGIDPRVNLPRDDYLNIDFSRQDIFRQHPVIDEPVWSSTFLSPVSGVPSVTLAVPVRQGILLSNIRLDRLSQELALISRGSVNKCAIVDHGGSLVASSELAEVVQRVNFNLHQVIGRTLHGKGETVLENHDDLTLLESTAVVPSAGWVAWVGVDIGTEMAPVNHIRNLLAGILAMALLAAGGIALLDARRLMLPLFALNERTAQIGAGNYDFQFQPSGFVEIDSLASSLQGMSQAINDRERLLISSEQRFRNLVNSIDGVVWEMDVTSGSYLFVSEQSAAMFGYAPAQWLDTPDFWQNHVFPGDAERIVIRGRRSLALNEKHDLEYRFIDATGNMVWVRDLVTIIWEENEPTHLLGVMIDISARKQTEAELERYRASLEELVAQRTRELQAAQSELVRKERLVVLGQLTATVSHEIRNPLGTVSNALYLIRETLDNESLGRVEPSLVLAERSVARCDGIISELLDFTRRRELQCEPVQLDSWLSDMLDEMVLPNSVCCLRQLDSGVTVPVDQERLRRAVINVISNALQSMDGISPEKRCLTVATRRLADRCEIVVSDTGEGIPEAIMGRIFEPLFSTKTFGIGLGVPIIRNIMTDHGGGVDYQSRVGEGTTVILWLPLSPSSTPQMA